MLPKVNKISGLGSAIVDLSIKVDQAFLDKYEMHNGQASITDNVNHPFIEEILANDKVHYTLGGSIMNSLRAISWALKKHNSEFKFRMVSGFANDELGKIIEKGLQDSNVENLFEYKENFNTARCGVALFEKERTMMCYIGTTQKFTDEFFEQNFESFMDFDTLLIEGYFLTADPLKVKKITDTACQRGNKFIVSSISSPFIALFFAKELKELVINSDIVFSNHQEILAWAKGQGLTNTENVLEICKESCVKYLNTEFNQKRKVFVVTDGGNPITVVDYNAENSQFEFETTIPLPTTINESEIEDKNGPGDTFLGCFIAAKLFGKNYNDCVELGNRGAIEVLKKVGCDIPREIDLI